MVHRDAAWPTHPLHTRIYTLARTKPLDAGQASGPLPVPLLLRRTNRIFGQQAHICASQTTALLTIIILSRLTLLQRNEQQHGNGLFDAAWRAEVSGEGGSKVLCNDLTDMVQAKLEMRTCRGLQPSVFASMFDILSRSNTLACSLCLSIFPSLCMHRTHRV
jgi:hypothetical protein